MSKEIIDRIKQTESKAAEELAAARVNADKLVKEAKENAAELFASETKKAAETARLRLKEAEDMAAAQVKDAEAKAMEEKQALKESAGSKQAEAVKEVINMLL